MTHHHSGTCATERPDLKRLDLARPDLEGPDLERPDLERPDLARPDLARPDLARPDLERRDLERPELERPDLERPDLERPDVEGVGRGVGGAGVRSLPSAQVRYVNVMMQVMMRQQARIIYLMMHQGVMVVIRHSPVPTTVGKLAILVTHAGPIRGAYGIPVSHGPRSLSTPYGCARHAPIRTADSACTPPPAPP
jgi:hypothetical protein